MLILSEDALILCKHAVGRVSLAARQSWVTVSGRPVLVEGDPEGRPIHGCPNAAPGNKPCLNTLVIKEGYSTFVRIDGRAICLDSVSGFTDGVPPGLFRYTVKNAGQAFVRSSA